MRDLQFGFSLNPTTDIAAHRDLVRAAEEGGLDLVGVQDHPYSPTFVDAFTLIASLLEATERLRFFPDVANLPLRHPSMLAKTAASLDLLSSGRFELGIGGGGYWSAIARMGMTPQLGRPEALAQLGEAIQVLRALWRPTPEPVTFEGQHYTIPGLHSGPTPAHPIGIWVGAQGPRSLELTGRVADGWAAPIPSYLPYEKWAESNALIDEAALASGRNPQDVLRIAQLVGTITDRPGDAEARAGKAPVRATAEQWAALLARLATEQPFRTFVFWPEDATVGQIERFAREVVPAVREIVRQGAEQEHSPS
ncbi:LLM class flavin-dependent oxidoreductase [Streptomyces sp. NPDC018833]|uniref:LLM class flavin-dependent oxidoreductase n=1 Tax=Streptomyces sp. NPDC018833 TaxID=3365053 RepID=UPI00379FA990